jgi:pyruvate dehydrogenase E1 component alpha subunit
MGTDIRRVSAVPEIYKRAIAYDMHGEPADGMDVIKFHDVMKEAADRCRKGQGPVLIEANTYRYRGHSMSDAATYRTKEEVEEEKTQNDPITKLRDHLLKKKIATEPQLDAIDDEEKKICEQAVAFADAAPEPPLEEVYGDIYVQPGEPDTHPRERVLGAKDVKWPKYPSGTELKVTWDLEPQSNVTPITKKKGAA